MCITAAMETNQQKVHAMTENLIFQSIISTLIVQT